jgi:hypothetical protein
MAELIDEAAGTVGAVDEPLWLVSCAGLMSPLPATGVGVSEADNSLCNGEEWTGDSDFLLCESMVWPRDELRGETRPV